MIRYRTWAAVQAERLGEYLVSQRIQFESAYAGAMARQQQTAAHVAACYKRAGLGFPEVQTLPAWNEFDLDHVYQRTGAMAGRC